MRALPADPQGRELFKLVARDRYERWLSAEVERVLTRAFVDIAAELTDKFGTLTPSERARLDSLFMRVDDHLRKGYSEAARITGEQVRDYAGVEARGATYEIQRLVDASPLEASVAFLSPIEVRKIAELPIAGLRLGDWWEKQVQDMGRVTRQNIQLGLIRGEPIRDIAKRIIPPRGDFTTPAAFRQARMRSELIVRTALTTVQNAAALESFKAVGDEFTNSYQYVSARDNRVSKICRALDGRIFRYSDPRKKMPPQHINCRSTIVPVVNYESLGLSPPPKRGAGMQSYDAWLRSQSQSVQSELLGARQADAYRSGKVTLGQLVASDGRAITLQQLALLLGPAK